ncbi:MAG: hypothetical protein KAJ57_10325 [Woeseiaceae bacterium]|nr:hypothetical protein [Woeseiaceae bacterium]
MNYESSVMGQPYEIVSIRRAAPPVDAVGADWYDYKIARGNHIIHGCRQGKLKAVTIAVEEIVVQLNERRFGKRGYASQVPAPKKKLRT